MTQTASTKLTLEDSTGNRISTPGIKSFTIGTDNNLVIYLDQPFNFTDLLPDISVDDTQGTYTNCQPTKPASVTATQPAAGTSLPITFKVTSATPGTSFTMPVGPESIASFNTTTNTFSWNIGGSPPVLVGSYLAVFEGTSGANKSQLVVMIKINPAETVTAPTVSGPSAGAPGVFYQFTASGSTSTLSHDIEYQFDWGDGNQSGWSASPQSHSWGTASTTPYNIKAKARCVPDHVESAWSGTSPITISNIPTYTVTVNVVNNPSTATGGSVSPMSRSGITSGGQAIFNVTVTSGFTASVNGGSLSGTTGTVTWTFTDVTSDIPNATITFTQQPTTPTGEAWVWDRYPMFFLNPEEEKVYIVNINANYTYLKMSISGLTMNTMGTFSWTFPDGRILPQNSKQGLVDIVSMNGAGVLALRAGNNIPDNPIPQGNHVLRISASVPSSYFKISIEAY